MTEPAQPSSDQSAPASADPWRTATPGSDQWDTAMPSSSFASAVPDGVTGQTRYEFLGKLGEGGMGAVYRARDTQLGRVVALKVIRPEILTTSVRARFLEEARLVANLDHPHIIKVFDVGEHQPPGEPQPIPYIALELVEGGDLAERIHAVLPSLTEAVRIVAILARAMQHAHERGVVHRDLKPDNVLLAPPTDVAALNTIFGCPKITDFGLARQFQGGKRLTHHRAIMGTPHYMAPEQAEGEVDVGPPADVYALGGILYRLLTGQLPFNSNCVPELLFQVCKQPPPSPRSHRPEIPTELETICLHCLQKQPASRPSAAELACRLEQFLVAPTPDPPQPSRVAWPFGLSRRALVGGVLFLVCGVFLAGLGLWHTWLHQPEQGPRPNPQVAAPHILPLRVLLFQTVNGNVQGKGRLGDAVHAARAGDSVTIQVRLHEPGYFYLLGFNFDGREKLLWPTDDQGEGDESKPPPQLAYLHFPRSDGALSLDGKASQGLQAYVVAASSQPLPSYRAWKNRRGPVPWISHPPGRTVWQADGEGAYSVVVGMESNNRQIRSTEGAFIGELCQKLLGGGVECVEALAFPVLPREKP